MYKHVLVPISFEEESFSVRALDAAQVLANKGADITLLHVFEAIPAHAMGYLPENYATERRGAILSELKLMASKLPNAVARVVTGHASRAILDFAAENGVDCIVVASNQPGMQDLLLGSTAARVVRHARCAVHVLR